MYKCLKCGREIDLKEIRDKIRCPYCGYRIVATEKPKTVIKVKAI